MANPYQGFLVVDKEKGPTSHDVVAMLRRALHMRRIGHCGTLDPLATGVLVICLGPYTRLSGWISDREKEYQATFVLGSTSETGDAQGPITPLAEAVAPSLQSVCEHLERFKGSIEQVPHAYSAVKINGMRSHRLARRDQPSPRLRARQVRIEELEIRAYEYPNLDVRIVCSKGTYIRSLAADFGSSLGCGAYVGELRRHRVGNLDLAIASTVSRIQRSAEAGTLAEQLVPPRIALGAVRPVLLPPSRIQAFAHGTPVTAEPPGPRNVECAVYDEAERLCGIGRWTEDGRTIQPLKVLAQSNSKEGDDDTKVQSRKPDGVSHFSGVVAHGEGRGKKLGFPTANLAVDDNLLARLPPGVFAGRVWWENADACEVDDHAAIVNVGVRPTFGERDLSVELHILDFSGDLYGRTLHVSLQARLRDEQRFPDRESLVDQIRRDVETARRIFA